MMLPKTHLNRAIVHLREIGWTSYLIAKAFNMDKANAERKYKRWKEVYTLTGKIKKYDK